MSLLPSGGAAVAAENFKLAPAGLRATAGAAADQRNEEQRLPLEQRVLSSVDWPIVT